MVFTRRNVWANGGDFSDPILLWYARGVTALQQRPLSDPTSWRFMAAIHGFNPTMWSRAGYFDPNEPQPSTTDSNVYWNQCQHRSWYFLPWHRGYLASIEAILKAAIIDLNGPDDWAMPYWNYSDGNNPLARQLPPAFLASTMPDGNSNPLLVARRFGNGSVPFEIDERDTRLRITLAMTVFVSPSNGVGFGGPVTDFNHLSGQNGGLESRPHNGIHTQIGGEDAIGFPGLMSHPATAALDPIFWLHHANIDRLWSVWLNRNPAHQNPDLGAWLNGPLQKRMVVPRANGQQWVFTSQDMLSTTSPDLDYEYDDISDPLGGDTSLSVRFRRLNVPLFQRFEGSEAMPQNTETDAQIELLGVDNTSIDLTGTKDAVSSARVRLDTPTINRVNRSFRILSQRGVNNQEPDRVLLNIEQIRSARDGATIDVYLNPYSSERLQDYADYYVGSIAFFGVESASNPQEPHGGNGVTQVFDVTEFIDELYQSDRLGNTDNLRVELVNRYDIKPEAEATVGRISFYRQHRTSEAE